MKDTNYINLLEELKTSDDKKRTQIIDNLSTDYNNTIPLLCTESLKRRIQE